jgi:hypothetical protein
MKNAPTTSQGGSPFRVTQTFRLIGIWIHFGGPKKHEISNMLQFMSLETSMNCLSIAGVVVVGESGSLCREMLERYSRPGEGDYNGQFIIEIRFNGNNLFSQAEEYHKKFAVTGFSDVTEYAGEKKYRISFSDIETIWNLHARVVKKYEGDFYEIFENLLGDTVSLGGGASRIENYGNIPFSQKYRFYPNNMRPFQFLESIAKEAGSGSMDYPDIVVFRRNNPKFPNGYTLAASSWKYLHTLTANREMEMEEARAAAQEQIVPEGDLVNQAARAQAETMGRVHDHVLETAPAPGIPGTPDQAYAAEQRRLLAQNAATAAGVGAFANSLNRGFQENRLLEEMAQGGGGIAHSPVYEIKMTENQMDFASKYEISRYNIVRVFDVFPEASFGYYGATLNVFDISTGKYSEQAVADYHGASGEDVRADFGADLSRCPIGIASRNSSSSPFNEVFISLVTGWEPGEEGLHYSPTSKPEDLLAGAAPILIPVGDLADYVKMKRFSTIYPSHAQGCECVFEFNCAPNMHVGQCFDIKGREAAEPNKFTSWIDGKWLITGVRHSITIENATTYVTACRANYI